MDLSIKLLVRLDEGIAPQGFFTFPLGLLLGGSGQKVFGCLLIMPLKCRIVNLVEVGVEAWEPGEGRRRWRPISAPTMFC